LIATSENLGAKTKMTKSKMTTNKLAIAVSPRGIASLTLSRPEKGNALDTEMLEGMSAALERLSDDARVRVIVLRGEGRHFCAGADIAGIKIADEAAHDTERVSIASICARLDSCPKPTIAVVHGACLGGGLAIAACCDAVLAETDAFFGIPEVRLGFAPTALMPFFLAACGARFLRRYLLSGERFEAKCAAQIGLVSEVRDASDLEAALANLVESFLLAGPAAVSIAKSGLRGANAAKAQAATSRQDMIEEAKEGAASFRAKRHPSWYPPASS
jgi:methylglutaconyl-CoA hydratase